MKRPGNVIINSPFVCPAQHWVEGKAGLEIKPERRPASYEVIDSRNNTKRVETLDLVNTIRGRVDAWRAAGWPGITIVTRPAGRPGDKVGHRVEHGAPLFSRRYGQATAVVIFDWPV